MTENRKIASLTPIFGHGNNSSEVSMRVLMIAVVNLLLTGLILGQQSKFNDVGQDIQLAKPITKQQLLELPPTDKAPRIPLQRALMIAESFIKKQKINLSSSYLFEVKWVRADVNEEPK